MSPGDRSDSKQFPGAFRELSRPRARYLFGVGIVLCLVLLGANIIRDNKLLHLAPSSILGMAVELKVIGSDAAITLFVGLVAGLLAYQQFYSVQRPYLTYNCLRTDTVTFDPSGSGRYWTTVLRNGGGGLARVTSVSYRIRLANGKTFESEHYAEVVAFLEANHIREGADFVLFRLSNGETIRAGSDWLVLEVGLEIAKQKVDAFDLTVHVTGVAGGCFMREIYCIPRRWEQARKTLTAAALKKSSRETQADAAGNGSEQTESTDEDDPVAADGQ